jgi:hypothetical protein
LEAVTASFTVASPASVASPSAADTAAAVGFVNCPAAFLTDTTPRPRSVANPTSA